jgi:hypothetical protein
MPRRGFLFEPVLSIFVGFAEIISIPLDGEGELNIRAPFDQIAAEVA